MSGEKREDGKIKFLFAIFNKIGFPPPPDNKISEQIESKKAQRELFKGFIRALEKQGALVEEFDEGLWSSLVREVVVNTKDDIRFIFKNGFEIKTR